LRQKYVTNFPAHFKNVQWKIWEIPQEKLVVSTENFPKLDNFCENCIKQFNKQFWYLFQDNFP